MISAPLTNLPAAQIATEVQKLPKDGALRLRMATQDSSGDMVDKLVRLTLGAGNSVAERLATSGITLNQVGEATMIQSVRFGSEARKYGLQPGDKIGAVVVPADRPTPYWFAIPALVVLALIVLAQRRRWERLRPTMLQAA
jgi:hypothetical protein